MQQSSPVKLQQILFRQSHLSPNGHRRFIDHQGMLGYCILSRIHCFEKRKQRFRLRTDNSALRFLVNRPDHLPKGLADKSNVANTDQFRSIDIIFAATGNTYLVASGLLRRIQSLIRLIHQIRRTHPLSIACQPDADGQPSSRQNLRTRETMLRNRSPYSVRKRQSRSLLRIRYNHQKLFAAKPSNNFGRPHTLLQQDRQLGENRIARHMPMKIIILFKIIQIQHRQFQGALCSPGDFNRLSHR